MNRTHDGVSPTGTVEGAERPVGTFEERGGDDHESQTPNLQSSSYPGRGRDDLRSCDRAQIFSRNMNRPAGSSGRNSIRRGQLRSVTASRANRPIGTAGRENGGIRVAPVMSAAVDSAAAADGPASIVKNAIKVIWGDASGTSPRIHYLQSARSVAISCDLARSHLKWPRK
jgi:hypothetical protein